MMKECFDPESVAGCILNGQIALVPTDTVYGLVGLPGLPTTEARIFNIKRRPANRHLPILVSSQQQLHDLGVKLNRFTSSLIESEFVPGPLSIAAGITTSNAPSWLKERDEIAFRFPNEEFLLEILNLTGPLLSTSANIHKHDTPNNVEEILQSFDDKPDVFVDLGTRDTIPSTLVNCNTLDIPVIEREGVISNKQIKKVLDIE